MKRIPCCIALLGSVALLATAASSATAQEQKRPEGWITRFDRAGQADTAVLLVDMPPGWHVTSGPSGIHYDPRQTAQGNFRLEAPIFLFPDSREREAFGVFFGGRNLQGDEQAYSYFLIRGDGSFLVKRRDGSRTPVVVDWTQHDAVEPKKTEGQAKNTLAVEAGPDTVEFFVNDAKVASVPRSDLLVDGVVGLRVNHGLNLHITTLEVTRK